LLLPEITLPAVAQSVRGRVRIWVQTVRPFAFTASLTPVSIGAAVAFSERQHISWSLFPLVAVCAVLLHAATNVISEYYDFKKGVDRNDAYVPNRVLVDGLIEPGEVLIGGYLFALAGFLLGLILVAARGWPMLLLGMFGLLGGIFYSASPVGYKYLGLGDIMVFLLMGPLMVAGSYFALTGSFAGKAVYVSLPVGFLVTAILNANNLRDIQRDRQAGVKTLENVLGYRFAKGEYVFLLCASFASVGIMMWAGVLALPSALVFLSFPLAMKNIRLSLANREDNPAQIALLDRATARLHLVFGLLLFVSLTIRKT
jgi:1,4-dihydroxy-2-naphthoate polyprenyltransferase